MTTHLPLIRLSAANPFLMELKRRGIDSRSLLCDLGLPTDVPASHDLFVESDTVYALVERCAELAQDIFFGFTIGCNLDLRDWEPISDAVERASTIGELLSMFAVNSSEHSSATRFLLTTDADRSTFGLERKKAPEITPAQNDAFYTGFMQRLLRHATRDHWDPAAVLYSVADPACIRTNGEGYRLAQGGPMGVRVGFPSNWLFERFEKSVFKSGFTRKQAPEMPRSLIDSLQTALRPHLQRDDLSADKAARLCGYDRRRLSRELRELGTTLSKEIARLRSDRASQQLVDTDQSIADIAEGVGFTDPTVFSRAFKKWTGLSPRDYRRTHRSPGE